MSGIVKSVGKVFRKVGKVVKKIAPYIMIAAAIYFTGGAILAAAPALTGAAGAAGAAGAVGAGAAGAGSAAAAGGASGWLASIGLGSGGSALGGLLTNSAIGSALGGGARGLMQNMQMKDERKFEQGLIDDRIQRHQVNDSSLFDFSGSGEPQGLGVRTVDLTDPTAAVQNVASRPPRPSAIELAQNTLPERRIKYNRLTGVIDFA